MNKKFLTFGLAVAISMLMMVNPANGQDSGVLAAENFGGSTAFTTEYMLRGLSFTDGDPAVQSSLEYAHSSGFYMGIWGSNASIADGNVEMDGFAGFAGAMGDIGYDVTALYYTYPPGEVNLPDSTTFNPNFFELFLGLSYGLPVGGDMAPEVGVGYYFSPNYTMEDGVAHYLNGTLDIGLPMGLGAGVGFGYQTVAGGEFTPDGYSYSHYRVSLSKDLAGFTLDASYHGTDEDAKDTFGDLADSKFVLTLSRGFGF